MKGIDTNILVRFLLEDDEEQADRVQRLLSAFRNAGENIYICLPVLCEVAWVLRSGGRLPKSEILDHLSRLIEADIFVVEEEDLVRRAIAQARRGKGDFPDYLIGEINLARGCRFTVTFDRSLRSASAFSLL